METDAHATDEVAAEPQAQYTIVDYASETCVQCVRVRTDSE